MYYKLSETYDDDLYVDAVLLNMDDVMQYKVSIKETLGINFPTLKFKLNSDTPPSDYFKSGPFIIISKRLKCLLEKHNAKFEYYDVVIISKTKNYNIGEYYFAHVLCEVDFIDKKESIFTTDDTDSNYIDEVEILVINENKLKNEAVATLYRCFEPILIIRSDLINEMLQENITGFNITILKSV